MCTWHCFPIINNTVHCSLSITETIKSTHQVSMHLNVDSNLTQLTTKSFHRQWTDIKQGWSNYIEVPLPCGWQSGPVGRLPSGDPVTSWFGAAWVGHWWLWSIAEGCWRRWSSWHSGDCWPGKRQSVNQNNTCREKSD